MTKEPGAVEVWTCDVIGIEGEGEDLRFKSRCETEAQPLYEADLPIELVAPEERDFVRLGASFTMTVAEVDQGVSDPNSRDEEPDIKYDLNLSFNRPEELTKGDIQAALERARARRRILTYDEEKIIPIIDSKKRLF